MVDFAEITEIESDEKRQNTEDVDVDVVVPIKVGKILRALQRSLGKWSPEIDEPKKAPEHKSRPVTNKNTNSPKKRLPKLIRDFENFACSQRLSDNSKSELSYQQPRKKTCKTSKKLPPKKILSRDAEIQGCSKTLSNKEYKLLHFLKNQVDTAIKCNKIFTVCGNCHTIRKSLCCRRWVEKIRVVYNTINREHLKSLLDCSIPELLQGALEVKHGHLNRRIILSKLIGNNQVDFYWDQNFDCFQVCPDTTKFTLFNRFQRHSFFHMSKLGFSQAMKYKYYWFQNPGTINVQYPRSYYLSSKDDTKDFIQDYRLTAAISLLCHIVKKIDQRQASRVVSESGLEPMEMYHFAVTEVQNLLRCLEHKDIDYIIEESSRGDWKNFLETFYRIVHIGLKFKLNDADSPRSMLNTSKQLLDKIKLFRPNLDKDGTLNVWILKPINGSRGEGIYLCRTLQYIMKIIRINSTKKYIIQKYIEKPLIIYDTKFDIRQWFLVSSTTPLTIWMYKECYLRFSSQNYTLHRLNEAIHLTNNSVQTKYRNCQRHQNLPSCNMWDSNQFCHYLKSIGRPHVYKDIIYPEMKQAITAAILMGETFATRKNCFEIYGADFIITEDFKPWLIEINNRPAMHASTPVTARMCPQVLEDVIKVVIDYAENPSSSTGKFELIYQAKVEQLPPVDKIKLQLKGRQLPVSYFYEPEQTEAHVPPCVVNHYELHQAVSGIKKTLDNLLNLIQSNHRKSNLKEIPISYEDEDEESEQTSDSMKDVSNFHEFEDDDNSTDSSCNSSLEDAIKSIQNLTNAYNRFTQLCTQ